MRDRLTGENGFTLTEVLIASVVLVVGVLGVATLADVANQMTSRADGRSGATSISRRVSEAARGLTTTQLAPATLLGALKAAAPSLADSTPADDAWTVKHRGGTYLITAAVCTVDDPTDGYAAPAARDTGYCAQPAATSPPDGQPDDYRRVTVAITDQRRPTDRIRQFTDVSSGSSRSLPLITDLSMRQDAGSCTTDCTAITAQSQSTVVFDATTVNDPAAVQWLIDGRAAADCPPTTVVCSGAGNAWSFNWEIRPVEKETLSTSPNLGLCKDPTVDGAIPYQLDGVYQVGVQGFDSNAAGGGAASMTIMLNRCVGGVPPQGLDATGRDAAGPVDVEWRANLEGDILGYRVYKGASPDIRTPVCPPSITNGEHIPTTAATECLDAGAADYSGSPFYYGVYVVDRDPVTGALREGAVSYVDVNSSNKAPNAIVPDSLVATRSDGKVTLTWTIPAVDQQDPDYKADADRHESFRIYRRSGDSLTTPALTDRLDRELLTVVCTGTTCTWTDTSPLGTTSAYWVRAVDTHLRESPYSAGLAA